MLGIGLIVAGLAVWVLGSGSTARSYSSPGDHDSAAARSWRGGEQAKFRHAYTVGSPSRWLRSAQMGGASSDPVSRATRPSRRPSRAARRGGGRGGRSRRASPATIRALRRPPGSTPARRGGTGPPRARAMRAPSDWPRCGSSVSPGRARLPSRSGRGRRSGPPRQQLDRDARARRRRPVGELLWPRDERFAAGWREVERPRILVPELPVRWLAPGPALTRGGPPRRSPGSSPARRGEERVVFQVALDAHVVIFVPAAE